MYEVRYINYLYAMAMFSDDPILWLLFSSRQRISNHFPLTTYMFSGWVLLLLSVPIPMVSVVTIFDLVSSSSFGEYYKAETFPLILIFS